MNHLGHILKSVTLLIFEKAIRAIHILQRPTDLTDLRYFLGLWNFYQRFPQKPVYPATHLIWNLETYQLFNFDDWKNWNRGTRNAATTIVVSINVDATRTKKLAGYITRSCTTSKLRVSYRTCTLESQKDRSFPITSLHKAEKAYEAPHRKCLVLLCPVTLMGS